MAIPTNLLNRIEILERKMLGLDNLPARLDALSVQVEQLHHEMREGFSALRAELRAGDEKTRESLRAEFRAGLAETRTHILVLHEDLIERIKRLGGGGLAAPPASLKAPGGEGPGRKRPPRRRR